jgi:hypothetical protein
MSHILKAIGTQVIVIGTKVIAIGTQVILILRGTINSPPFCPNSIPNPPARCLATDATSELGSVRDLKEWRGVEMQLHIFLTSALYGI